MLIELSDLSLSILQGGHVTMNPDDMCHPHLLVVVVVVVLVGVVVLLMRLQRIKLILLRYDDKNGEEAEL